jgi:hypothetical protein
MELLSQIKIDEVAAAATSAGTDVNGTTVDLSGYEGVIFYCSIATANAGNFLKAQEGDTSSPTADIAASKVVATVNGQVVALQIHKPLKRYVRAVVVRAGANTATGQVYALLYGSKELPDTGADVNVLLASPIAGTP